MYFWRALPTREPLGLDRGQWQALHIVLSLLVVLTAAVHVWYNWGAVKHYLRRRRASAPRPRREWAVALALVAVVAAGSAAGLPPFSLLVPKHDRHGPPAAGQAMPRDPQPPSRPTA
jgi:hypothetical protein